MKYGYARVSTSKQELDNQVSKLKLNGAEVIYSEKFTGTKKSERKELSKLLNIVKSGDEVIVMKIDRLARSITDLRELVNEFLGKGVSVSFIVDNMSFKASEKASPLQVLMLNMLGSFAEFERDLIVSRTQEGKAYAKANNKDFREGRPPRQLNKRYLHAVELMETHTMREVEQMTKISRATLYRIKRQYKAERLVCD
ncbi:recombinase family protein [Enterococcus italicus]|uniref:recombinase family protein n=1 Tax=Enterococcus italicus TaxID=246144 RepID=UPI0020735950|nr:recombinase family protein [Enterococcus italicus]MCM6930543.1 recombinase family protein [Enterococcus italicus]